jgi:AGCS family alanine or glycine:cation symporter
MVIIGGIKRIGAVAERLVPTMIFLYVMGTVIIVFSHFTFIDDAFRVILESAFSVQAVGGALIGTSVQRAISLGVSRGVLSNESGLDSAAIAQSVSKSSDPTKNGLIAMTGTFIDTLFVNTFTTLTIVLTGVYLLTPAAGLKMIVSGSALSSTEIALLHPEVVSMAEKVGYDLAQGGLSSTALTITAFNSVIPFGGWIIAISSFLFGYTTLIGWSFYSEQCLEYLAGVKVKQPYRLVYILLLFFGAILHGKYLDIVWNVGDIANAFMALPNLIGLIFLAGLVAKITSSSFSGIK